MQTDDKNVVRSLGTLLSLNSYQDMSDDEIESIIAYKTTMAYNKGNSDAIASQRMINSMNNKKRMDAILTRAENMIYSNRGEVS